MKHQSIVMVSPTGCRHRSVVGRTILFFGDSNTWGCPPGGDEWLPRHIRWTDDAEN